MNQNEENLLREFVRRTIIPHVTADLKQEHIEEQKARRWARNLIKESREKSILESLFEAKDMANPHPNTGINKLRDAIRKAKPSIKSKYQQLTTDAEQRESFTNHFLGAMVRLFDELDALSAQGEEALDVASEFDSVNLGSDIEAPPADLSSDDLADDIEGELGLTESILREVDIDIEDDAVSGDIVSDEFKDEEESEKIKNKSQAEKDFDKKSEDETKRKDFGDGLEGDATGRNQAFDAFNLVQSYFSDAYLDLNNPNDMEMFKKWGLYNVKLLLDKYENELESNPQAPEIQNPT
jgi:hypothetical protein|tara:strand:+ start:3733 stop:4620 length:888 start_codon:yes stop_codon:yes gene_type:complete